MFTLHTRTRSHWTAYKAIMTSHFVHGCTAYTHCIMYISFTLLAIVHIVHLLHVLRGLFNKSFENYRKYIIFWFVVISLYFQELFQEPWTRLISPRYKRCLYDCIQVCTYISISCTQIIHYIRINAKLKDCLQRCFDTLLLSK